jgi:hypothetical protein
MINEDKEIFENIKNLRYLLTEAVGQDAIIKAIQNHEWVYIYYDAQNEDGKNATGYRVVRPYVLGTNATGKTMLRAWQDNPKNSWHFINKPTRGDSQYHDYWSDSEGVKPGWRMFDTAKITKIYPIGKKFNDNNGLPLIPAGYHEGGDKDMVSIIAYVSTKNEPDFDYKYDKEYQPDVKTKTEISKEKWDSIRRGNKNRKQITSNDVVKLSDIATHVQKSAKGNYLVVIDNKNNFQLITRKDAEKQNIPDIAIVGSLPYLYDSLVKKNAPANDTFFNNVRNSTQTKLRLNNQAAGETEVSENKLLTTIPYKIRTFFK